MPEPDVVLERVTKRFGTVVAADDLSLSISKGEFIAFIGPSGCGKTTTLRLIAGLEQPNSGTIYIGGKNVDGVPAYKRNTAMVWQTFCLFPHLNVRRNIEYGLVAQGVSRNSRPERVRRVLRMLNMEELAERSITQLSGGQQQRVGLARALAVDPVVLLLDEPLGSLDANLRIRMQSELKSLQKKLGITFVYVTHNQSEAMAMADRIVVMNQGRIEQIGAGQDIYHHPATRFIAEFVGTNNIFDGQVFDVKGDLVAIKTPVGALSTLIRGDKPPLGQKITYLVSADAVAVRPLEANGENRLVATLSGEEFSGAMVKLFFSLENGSIFHVQQSAGALREVDLQLGRQAALIWESASAMVLPWG